MPTSWADTSQVTETSSPANDRFFSANNMFDIWQINLEKGSQEMGLERCVERDAPDIARIVIQTCRHAEHKSLCGGGGCVAFLELFLVIDFGLL